MDPEALIVLEKVLKIFEPILKDKEIQKVEPYWKIEEVYIVEVTMTMLISACLSLKTEKALTMVQSLLNRYTYTNNQKAMLHGLRLMPDLRFTVIQSL